MKTPRLNLADVQQAQLRLRGGLRLTPCNPARAIAQVIGTGVWLKREDLQRTGSFKERGARNALLSLSDSERSRGVVAASAGNHALGLAFHGGALGVAVTVVMPSGAAAVKIARCRGLGAHVVLYGETFEDAQGHAHCLAAATGATHLHPFDDLRVIAGQGTVALEILEQVRELDTIVVPVGGGGLLAGVATAVKAIRPGVRVIAVEPENAAGFLAACLHGAPRASLLAPTLADGLAVCRVGSTSFAVAAPLVDDVVTVSETEIAQAIRMLARDEGIVAEGAGAVGVAALLAGKISGRSLVLPIGGRNIDARLHERIMAGSDRVPMRWARAA
ncbi:MAG: threonine/serine dehydratase [Opitutus sp.]